MCLIVPPGLPAPAAVPAPAPPAAAVDAPQVAAALAAADLRGAAVVAARDVGLGRKIAGGEQQRVASCLRSE